MKVNRLHPKTMHSPGKLHKFERFANSTLKCSGVIQFSSFISHRYIVTSAIIILTYISGKGHRKAKVISAVPRELKNIITQTPVHCRIFVDVPYCEK